MAIEGRACGLNHRQDKAVRLRGRSMRKGRLRVVFFIFFIFQLRLIVCSSHLSDPPVTLQWSLFSVQEMRVQNVTAKQVFKKVWRRSGPEWRERERKASRAAELLHKPLFGFLKKSVSLYDIMHRNKDINQFRPLHWGRPVAPVAHVVLSFNGFTNAATLWPGFVQASGGK